MKAYRFGCDSAGRPIRLMVGGTRWLMEVGPANSDAAAASVDTRCAGAAAGPTRTDSRVGAPGAGAARGGNAVHGTNQNVNRLRAILARVDRWCYLPAIDWGALPFAALLLGVVQILRWVHLHGHSAGVAAGVLWTLGFATAVVFLASIGDALGWAADHRKALPSDASAGLDAGGQR